MGRLTVSNRFLVHTGVLPPPGFRTAVPDLLFFGDPALLGPFAAVARGLMEARFVDFVAVLDGDVPDSDVHALQYE